MKDNHTAPIGKIRLASAKLLAVAVAAMLGLSSFRSVPEELREELSLDIENATLPEIFRQITRETGYEFVFSGNQLSKVGRISISAENADIHAILEECLRDTHLWYVVEDGMIVISPKISRPVRPEQRAGAHKKGKNENQAQHKILDNPKFGINILN